MNRKFKLSAAVVATLMLGILAVNLALATTTIGTASKVNSAASVTNTQVSAETSVTITADQATNADQLKELVPATPEEAEQSICPVRTRYLMYTYDGVHIMWGVFGYGRFVGTDNLGKRAWGIYGRGVFAGFYDGEFFWGRYVNGTWKAQYLFGLENSCGKYVLFPLPVASAADVSSAAP